MPTVMGLFPWYRTLFSTGVKQIGVISASEAWAIREIMEEVDILVFGPVLSEEDLSWIVEEKLVLVCNNWLDLKKLSRYKTVSRIHLKFDIGFSRLGFELSSTRQLYDFLKDNPQIQLEGLAAQLVAGEELGDKKSFSSYQLEQFSELKKIFSCKSFHILNTSALISSFAHGDKIVFGARPGIGLYGVKPEILFKGDKAKKRWKDLLFSPVSSLKSYIVAIHQLEKGDTVSYGGTWRASRLSQIATVSLGYGDGFLRSFGSFREVLLRGRRVPVVGVVCMDFFMVDVTDFHNGEGASIKIGEEVIIFGRQGEDFLSPQSQAECMGTISYELFSRLGSRVERIYKT